MSELMNSDSTLRLTIFLTVLVVMAAWEALSPARSRKIPRRIRWTNNLLLIGLNTLLARLLVPVTAMGVAAFAETREWGLLPVLTLPAWLKVLLAVLILDLVIYGQHRLLHIVPALWRLHRVHHADLDFDVTTGLRFHPLEILLSLGIKFVAIIAVGASPEAVIVFEIVLNATAQFNHANLKLPVKLDAFLRLFLVTPDMHRVHHSIIWRETNSNFGFNLPWWDFLFHTYIAQPEKGHTGMTIGIEQFREPPDLRLDRMLTQPFRHS